MAVTILGKSGRIRQYTATVNYTDLATGATTNNISLFTLPIKGEVLSVWGAIPTTFNGGGLTTYTLSIGTSAGELLATTSVFSGTPTITAKGTGFTSNVYAKSNTATTDIRVFAVGSGNLNLATQGQAIFRFTIVESD